MNGWIKLHREIIEKPIWQCSTPEQKTILITLLMIVNIADKTWEWQGEKFNCKAGQIITSLDKIAKLSGKGITIQNVRTALIKFEKYDFLTNISTKTGRLITIVNWSLYQHESHNTNKDTNNELTKHQQSANKELTTTKEYKNNKNNKKYIYSSIDERLSLLLQSLILERDSNSKTRVANIPMWSSNIEKLHRIDKREYEDIENVIRWCQQDSFWQNNILSTKKLREKFDTLLGQSKSKHEPKKDKVDNFNNFEQRNYDYDDLEKKLLGW